MMLPPIRCELCGDAELFAATPGQDGASCELFDLTPAKPAHGWCEQCWVRKFGLQRESA